MPVIISESFARRHQSIWWDWTAPRHGKSAVLAVFNGLTVQPINCIWWRLEPRRTHRGSDRIDFSLDIHILCCKSEPSVLSILFNQLPNFSVACPLFSVRHPPCASCNPLEEQSIFIILAGRLKNICCKSSAHARLLFESNHKNLVILPTFFCLKRRGCMKLAMSSRNLVQGDTSGR